MRAGARARARAWCRSLTARDEVNLDYMRTLNNIVLAAMHLKHKVRTDETLL